MEASVWVKKYLIADSLEFLFEELRIMGMKAKVFNSNLTQLNSKEGDDKIIKILVNRHTKNKIKEGLINIGKKEKFLSMGHEPISFI
jgi:hypothetical protein